MTNAGSKIAELAQRIEAKDAELVALLETIRSDVRSGRIEEGSAAHLEAMLKWGEKLLELQADRLALELEGGTYNQAVVSRQLH